MRLMVIEKGFILHFKPLLVLMEAYRKVIFFSLAGPLTEGGGARRKKNFLNVFFCSPCKIKYILFETTCEISI